MRGLIIDTETTGLSHNYNQVLTVGMLYCDISIKRPKFLDSLHVRVKHDRYNVSGIALKINKINLEEHHKIAIDSRKACLEMNRFIMKNKIREIPLIGHNIGFDIRFLRELYRQSQKEYLLDLETVDTRNLWNNLKNRGIVPSTLKGSLRTVAEHFDVSYEGAHDALGDCHITANVLHKILCLMKEKDL